MRFLIWLLALIVAILVVAFAVSNRASVTIAMWPFELGLSVPAYIAILSPLVVGLLLGWGAGGIGAIGLRFRARAQARRADKLERENAKLLVRINEQTQSPPLKIPPLS
jgi:uncharacterized integral membrane protein